MNNEKRKWKNRDYDKISKKQMRFDNKIIVL